MPSKAARSASKGNHATKGAERAARLDQAKAGVQQALGRLAAHEQALDRRGDELRGSAAALADQQLPLLERLRRAILEARTPDARHQAEDAYLQAARQHALATSAAGVVSAVRPKGEYLS